MVSIHRPLGYGPSTLPLRHAALLDRNDEKVYTGLLHGKQIVKNINPNLVA